jgi:membrane protease YdiL (CAAX protease family)
MEELASSTASTERQLQSVGTSIGLAVGGFVVSVIFVLVGGGVLRGLGVGVQSQPVLATVISIVLQGAGFGAAVVAFMSLTDSWDLVRIRMPTARDLLWIGGGLVVVFVSAVAIAQAMQTLGISSATNSIVEQGRENPGLIPLLIPLSVLVVGPGEELLFRGGVQGVLRKSYSELPAVAIAAALFGIAHTVALIGSGSQVLAYIAVTFVLGAVLGLLYERTDNIVVPAAVHGIYNAALFTMLYLQVSGGF